MAITRDAEQDTHFDPSACVEVVVSHGVGWVGLVVFDGLDGVNFLETPKWWPGRLVSLEFRLCFGRAATFKHRGVFNPGL